MSIAISKSLRGKKIGIWGTGIVGLSVARFLISKKIKIGMLDRSTPCVQALKFIENHAVPLWQESSIERFIQEYDYIIPSPGVDIRNYVSILGNKLLPELDFFQKHAYLPIIAVTGTVGKTSIVTLLEKLLSKLFRIVVGGNIGIGSADLLPLQKDTDYIILETSDIQLKYTSKFSPNLAIWTNFFPNHLVWHGTLDQYFNAKCRIFLNKKTTQALVPLELGPAIKKHPDYKGTKLHFFSTDINLLGKYPLSFNECCYFLFEKSFICVINKNYTTLYTFSTLPSITYEINWLIIAATLHLLGQSPSLINKFENEFILPHHRLEHVGTVHGIDFYNDSKSTIIQSTLNALEFLIKLQRPIILFLGGLSKGVDRSALIIDFKNLVDKVYCFGNEAEYLYNACSKAGVKAIPFPNLLLAFDHAIKQSITNDIFLFSPAGSSFDLYADYIERGNQFKELVYNYANKV